MVEMTPNTEHQISEEQRLLHEKPRKQSIAVMRSMELTIKEVWMVDTLPQLHQDIQQPRLVRLAIIADATFESVWIRKETRSSHATSVTYASVMLYVPIVTLHIDP